MRMSLLAALEWTNTTLIYFCIMLLMDLWFVSCILILKKICFPILVNLYKNLLPYISTSRITCLIEYKYFQVIRIFFKRLNQTSIEVNNRYNFSKHFSIVYIMRLFNVCQTLVCEMISQFILLMLTCYYTFIGHLGIIYL